MQFLCAVQCVIFNNFTINIGVGTYFVYCIYMNRDKKRLLLDMSIKQQVININGKYQRN